MHGESTYTLFNYHCVNSGEINYKRKKEELNIQHEFILIDTLLASREKVF